MVHDRLIELYDRYLGGELTPEEDAEMTALLGDTDSRVELRLLASLEGSLQEEMSALTAFPGSNGNILRPAQARPRRGTLARHRKPRRHRASAASLCAVLAAAAALLIAVLYFALSAGETGRVLPQTVASESLQAPEPPGIEAAGIPEDVRRYAPVVREPDFRREAQSAPAAALAPQPQETSRPVPVVEAPKTRGEIEDLVRKNIQDAMEKARAHQERNDEVASSMLRQARQLLEKQGFPAAEQLLKEIVVKYPDSPAAPEARVLLEANQDR